MYKYRGLQGNLGLEFPSTITFQSKNNSARYCHEFT